MVSNGFKFFFYANEHEPKHIHVIKGEGFAKVELESLKVVQNYLKVKDLKIALEIIKENQSNFISLFIKKNLKSKEIKK